MRIGFGIIRLREEGREGGMYIGGKGVKQIPAMREGGRGRGYSTYLSNSKH